jgi:hypothetical protein
MKFTWGHAMVLVLLSFMVFIVSFIIRLNISELVTEDYYSQEVKYQSLMDAEQNFISLSQKPSISFEKQEIKLSFPQPFNANNAKGTILFYRPSDAKKDLEIPILLDENKWQRIPTINLDKGKYQIILDWQTNGKRYYTKQILKIK